MRRTSRWIGAGLFFVAAVVPVFAAMTEAFRNEKVIVTEVTLAPGDYVTVADEYASVLVCLSGDLVTIMPVDMAGVVLPRPIQRGDTMSVPERLREISNSGHAPLHLVRVEFPGAGSDQTWGMAGLPPNYKVLFEDRHSRTYDIRIAAHAWEPQHTHHARVVVCLSGAQLEHVLTDGSVQPSTLRTDEVVWRLGQTHKGHNLGDTDLWVVAIEPK